MKNKNKCLKLIVFLIALISFVVNTKIVLSNDIALDRELTAEEYKTLENFFNDVSILRLRPWIYSESPWGSYKSISVFRAVRINSNNKGTLLGTSLGLTTNLSVQWKGGESGNNKNDFPNDFYIGHWVYFPKIGQYARYIGYYNGVFERKTPEAERIKEQELNLRKRLETNYDIASAKEILWFNLYGYNCILNYYENKKNPQIICVNELDTNNYERFYFSGNNMDKIDNRKIKMNDTGEIKETTDVGMTHSGGWNKPYDKDNKIINGTIIKVKEYRNKYIETAYNVKTIWKGYLKDDETLVDYFLKTLNKSENKKILLMVQYDQSKTFYNLIKKLPNGSLNNFKGYVWFMSNDDVSLNEKKYNKSKHDTQPDHKYDDELNRISNGNLKAKYGRYLTKERYSEDYVAPSIYGNNYNDKADW